MELIRKNKIIYQNRYMFFFFVFAVGYNFFVANRMIPWQVEKEAVASFYAVDYSYGFASRLLPGAIYRIIFGNVEQEKLTLFLTIITLLFFAGISYLLQEFLKSFSSKQKTTVLFLVMLYLSGAYTFSTLTKTIGLMDNFWIYLVLLFFLVVERKYGKYLIPLLFALCVLVHNGSLISYIPLMSIVLLYKSSMVSTNEEKRKYIFILIVSLVIALSLAVFFVLYEQKMVCSITEFHSKMHERGSDFPYYFDYAFFDLHFDKPIIPSEVYQIESFWARTFKILTYKIALNVKLLYEGIKYHLPSFLCGLSIITPFYLFFLRHQLNCFRKTKSRHEKFSLVLMIIQLPLTFIIAIPFSEDITRWFSHSFLIAFTLFLVVLYYDTSSRERIVTSFQHLLKTLYFKFYCLIYISFSMYTIY